MEDILLGPIIQAVILDNSYHVKIDVYEGVDRGNLECICGNRAMRYCFLSDAQMEILHAIGVFANPGVVLQNDVRLVTALVERWRPEINTFFMRQGEMTVTLEDVGYLLVLHVQGRLIVGDDSDSNKRFFARNWFELPIEQVELAFTREGVKFTWLYKAYGMADPGPDPRWIAIHTQAYLFFVLRSVLFPTSSRNVVHPKYIRHLHKLSQVPTWFWGSSVRQCFLISTGVCITLRTRRRRRYLVVYGC